MRVLLFSILLSFSINSFADSGYFGDCAGLITINGITFNIGPCNNGLSSFNGSNLGNVSDLTLVYGEQQTWENSGDDVYSGTLNYRIWTGTASGVFTSIDLSMVELLGGGDEKRSATPLLDLFEGLSASTTYTLEVYFDAGFNYTGGGGGSGTHYLSNGSANYQLTFTTPATLPIQLDDFSANVGKEDVLLSWNTLSEINADFFEVQRSVNNIDWEVLKQINALGNSTNIQSYNFIDKNPFFGINYYKLNQVDTDGNKQFSNTIMIQFYPEKTFRMFPNPCADYINIESLREESYSYTVYDLNGKHIISDLMDENKKLNTEEWNSGSYFIVFYHNSIEINREIIFKL